MEDPILNRNLAEVKELQTRWNQFHDFINMAMQQGAAKITPQAELKFLELKSRIAMLHDGFMGGVKSDAKTAQNILSIVANCIMLKKSSQASAAERQKFEFDWNECFMLLNDTISSLEEEQKRLTGINERSYKAAQMREMWKAKFHNFIRHPLFKYTVVSIIVIAGIICGEVFYGYRNLYTNPPMPFTKDLYKAVVNKGVRKVMKDFEYVDLAQIDINPKAPPGGTSDKITVTNETFISQMLPQMGFAQEDLEQAKQLFTDRVDFKIEQFKDNGKAVYFFAILFKTSASAKQFMALNRQGLTKLTADQKKPILDKLFVKHDANLVVYGFGEPASHYIYVIEKWNLKSNEGKNEIE